MHVLHAQLLMKSSELQCLSCLRLEHIDLQVQNIAKQLPSAGYIWPAN